MAKFSFRVSSDSPYPIVTEGIIETGGWQTAARIAVIKHREDLREKKKLRRQGDTVKISLTKLKTGKGEKDGD
jgi:hypothetical protein